LKAFFEKDADDAADQIDNLINLYSKGGQWCLGDKFTYADLFVYEMAARYFPSDNDLFLKKYQRIMKIKKSVEENSPAADYLKKSPSQKCTAHITREE
jgi:glutathione S-transferase